MHHGLEIMKKPQPFSFSFIEKGMYALRNALALLMGTHS
jgi:hypothetical protein